MQCRAVNELCEQRFLVSVATCSDVRLDNYADSDFWLAMQRSDMRLDNYADSDFWLAMQHAAGTILWTAISG